MIGSKYMKRLCTIIHKLVAMVDIVWIPRKENHPSSKKGTALHLRFQDDNESLLPVHDKTSVNIGI